MVQIVTPVCHACHAFYAIDSPNGGSRDSGDVVPIVSYIFTPPTPLESDEMLIVTGLMNKCARELLNL